MIETNFTALNLNAKKEKIRRIISAKASDLSPTVINEILDKIDINKQYTITSTKKIDILINNSYKEECIGESYSYFVDIDVIYGDFVPGAILDDGQQVDPEVGETAVAFIKTTSIQQDGKNNLQYSLFIYNPTI